MTRRREILICASAVLLAIVAVAAFAFRSRTIVHSQVDRRPELEIRAGADGCPALTTCFVAGSRPALIAAIRSAFPDAQIIGQYAVYGGSSTDPYREYVLARTGAQVALAVSTRCVNRGSAVPAAAGGPSSSAPRGPATVTITRPGSAGCSVSVVATVPDGIAVPAGQIAALAQTPGLQLRH